MAGIPKLARLVKQAKSDDKAESRIDIIVGGGVRSENLKELVEGTGAEWFHSSAVVGQGEEVDGVELGRMKGVLKSMGE